MSPTARVAIAAVAFGLIMTSRARPQGVGAIPPPHPSESRESRLGPSPGAGANPLGTSPGAGEPVFEGAAGSRGPRIFTDPTAQPQPGNAVQGPTALPLGTTLTPIPRLPVSPASPFGSLALPRDEDDEGPPDGLTLDQAIARLLRDNLDLRSKSFEIPQADADILTAGLRANPILYTDVQCVPYGAFTRARPGGQTQYDINITYPLDVSRKRKARTLVACQAKRVLEAQFQDAVREELDNLYTEFIDVLAARETVRESRQAVADLEAVPASPRGKRPDDDLRLEVQRESAEIALTEAEEQYKSDLRALGTLLKMTPAESERLQVRGSLHELTPSPPLGEPLLKLAIASRPDLVAYRLGIRRAEADVGLAMANRFPDVYLLYQPYTFQNDIFLFPGAKNATSWGVGLGVPLPIFNRNQGNVRRARLNVTQTMVEMAAIEDRVEMEVRQAERLYTVTRTAVGRIERSLLPRARAEHDRVTKLYLDGKADELAFLTAEHDFDQIVRQYRDTLVRHRRAMLRLNTAVGVRVLP
ncbi:MAG TPA: TolC family protein [Isosphaeraceae bacterium]